MQNHYNLVYREEEREMIPQCIDQGVGVIPWSPLARGVLAGNRTRDGERHTMRSGSDPFGDSLYRDAGRLRRGRAVRARWRPSAECRRRRWPLSWLLHRPGVTAPIVGATKQGHLADALAAEELTLTEEEIQRLRSRTYRIRSSGISDAGSSPGLPRAAAGSDGDRVPASIRWRLAAGQRLPDGSLGCFVAEPRSLAAATKASAAAASARCRARSVLARAAGPAMKVPPRCRVVRILSASSSE